MKKLLNYLKKLLSYKKLKCNLNKRMTVIDESLALKDMADIYAENVCKMNGWKVHVGYDGLSYQFCEIAFAFQNGYNKAIRDNGFEFKNGLVKKRDIVNDMPCGALRHYDEKIKDEALQDALTTLRQVLNNYGEPKSNINTIVNAFNKAMKANKAEKK